MSTKAIAPKKIEMYEKTVRMFRDYDKFMFLNLQKVLSTQFKNIKNEFPDDVEFLFAKNKIMRKALSENFTEKKYAQIADQIKENVIIAFYKEDSTATQMYETCQKFRRNAYARFGDRAIEDVIVPTGSTGLGPDQIQLFHAARMNTKMVKGKIEIAVAHKLVGEGEVVGISEANLLAKLNIMPFNYGLSILRVFEGDESFGRDVLAVSDEQIEMAMADSIAMVACVSLGTDTVTDASVPYEIIGASQEIKKVAAGVDYDVAVI
ncbi:RLA0 [Enterospora canceri]|uniref:Large ribosomal subunit protein uL10 n=1 Tax=Enterospora canceri TaxID=1081671 RepID=A0A1Y1S6K9_9MICR|nr:RLA0 [Enterospora canceri]